MLKFVAKVSTLIPRPYMNQAKTAKSYIINISSNKPSSTQQAVDYMESISDMVLFKLAQIKA